MKIVGRRRRGQVRYRVLSPHAGAKLLARLDSSDQYDMAAYRAYLDSHPAARVVIAYTAVRPSD